ncbi:MerR family transcriptional regulator [Streptomyces qinglanensis]|uniref:DNA-binding transcriptional regulator, MerR family n=1 Tax=Streptomyces qinglanensis TaxID=943816 RepID=A0A1H9NXX4_9ACTN|nr:MerR family transcriptional regulator [Streptomyces qinglanensis]SER40904.1 DNA-binding transcriptional regulator, MerR family [Streptomyces qinglanensis]
MRIGELAERAGTTTRTLRYYEARGLLAAARDAHGYRTFGEEDLRLLRQIRTLRENGFELEETRPFVECLRAGHPAGDSCPDSLEVYRRKLAELDACIAELRTVREEVGARLARAEIEAAAAHAPAPRCALAPSEPPTPREPEEEGRK